MLNYTFHLLLLRLEVLFSLLIKLLQLILPISNSLLHVINVFLSQFSLAQ